MLYCRNTSTATWQTVGSYEADLSVSLSAGTWRTFILSCLYQVMLWPPVRLASAFARLSFLGQLLRIDLIKLVSVSVCMSICLSMYPQQIFPISAEFNTYRQVDEWYYDGILYDSIQGQGHGDPKVAKMADFKVCHSASVQEINRLTVSCDTQKQYLNFNRTFFIFILVLLHVTFKLRMVHFRQTNFTSYEELTGSPVQGLLIWLESLANAKVIVRQQCVHEGP